MPTNVSPEYRKAEEAFRQAREPAEKLSCLKDMLRTIPKHKGTDHLQADIKRRIKQMTEDLAGPKKGAKRTGPTHTIRPEGAAQIALLGPPNSGKSSLHAKLTGSRTDIGPYPMTTREPVPGMMPYEDVMLQLIDLPAISADYMESWFVNALQPADAALLVADPGEPDCIEQVRTVISRLADRKIYLHPDWPGLESTGTDQAAPDDDDELRDPFRIELPTALVLNKGAPDADEVAAFIELLGTAFPTVMGAASEDSAADDIAPMVFHALQIVRIYTKSPGKPFKRDKPFTVRRGQTILDVARLVHKDFASGLRFARVWGEEVYDGQQVGPEHPVCDCDIVELHMK